MATAVVRMRGDRLPGGCPAPVYPPHIPLPHLHGAGGPPPPWGSMREGQAISRA